MGPNSPARQVSKPGKYKLLAATLIYRTDPSLFFEAPRALAALTRSPKLRARLLARITRSRESFPRVAVDKEEGSECSTAVPELPNEKGELECRSQQAPQKKKKRIAAAEDREWLPTDHLKAHAEAPRRILRSTHVLSGISFLEIGDDETAVCLDLLPVVGRQTRAVCSKRIENY